MIIRQRILREAAAGPELLLQAEVRVACLDAKSRRPRRIPEFVVAPERAAPAGDKPAGDKPAVDKEVTMEPSMGARR